VRIIDPAREPHGPICRTVTPESRCHEQHRALDAEFASRRDRLTGRQAASLIGIIPIIAATVIRSAIIAVIARSIAVVVVVVVMIVIVIAPLLGSNRTDCS
jgi:hypothetical protein